jgi:hypothetical protein
VVWEPELLVEVMRSYIPDVHHSIAQAFDTELGEAVMYMAICQDSSTLIVWYRVYQSHKADQHGWAENYNIVNFA